MTQHNVASMPEDYWAWMDTGVLVPLGICEGFNEACDKADEVKGCYHWIFSREGLQEMKAEILKELP